MNLFRMTFDGGRLRASGQPRMSLPAPPGMELPRGREILVGVRPHELGVRKGAEDEDGLPVRVTLTEHLGRNNYVVCRPEASDYLHEQDAIQIETDSATNYRVGDRLILSARAEVIRLFEPSGELIDRHHD
jgi:ABC-type sugar transport system ATPase subunit